jgi:YqaJ-like viral recombinase domain
MRVITTEQRTPEWLKARTGIPTASNVDCILAKLKRKDGEAATRANYKTRIVAEILTGRSQENFVSHWMEEGSASEPDAVAAYEICSGVDVEHTGFVLHPNIDRFGASPDGLVGDKGCVEAKCPASTTHLSYILADVVPEEYKPQMDAEIVCCEREWCDFISYDWRMPKHLQLFVKRYFRDDKRIAEMEAAVLHFLAEVDDIIARLPRPDGTRPDLVPILQKSLESVQTL